MMELFVVNLNCCSIIFVWNRKLFMLIVFGNFFVIVSTRSRRYDIRLCCSLGLMLNLLYL